MTEMAAEDTAGRELVPVQEQEPVPAEKPRSATRITKRSVEAGQPGATDQYLWDDTLKGFGRKLTPAGKRTYILQYRVHGRSSPSRRYTIGEHGSPWTAETARTEAERLLRLVKTGTDPAGVKSAAKEAVTVRQFWDGDKPGTGYLVHAESKKRASSVAEDKRNWRLHIEPALGAKRLQDLTTADIARFHASQSARPANANRCLALLSHMLTMAMRWGQYPQGANPCHFIEKNQEKKHERYLTTEEMARLGTALKASESKETWQAVAAIRLLALTGCRLTEILTLQWQQVDPDARCLRLPTSKTGAKIIPLANTVLAMVKRLPRVNDSLYVIPAARGDGHFVGIQRPWQRIRDRAKLHNLRIHDLRHSFASVAMAGGESILLVGKVLGHRQIGTTQRYAHLHDDPIRAVADRTAEQISRAMTGKKGRVKKGEKSSAVIIAMPSKATKRR